MANDQGLSLLDIGPMCERVPIGKDKKMLNVYGISAKGIFEIFTRFPQVQEWFKGAGNINAAELMKEAPDAIAAIIAAGCGCPGNEAAEENAASMAVESQLDVIEAIGRLTFAKGFGPFVERIVALSVQAKSVNYGRAPATKSPPPLKPSSPPATQPQKSGN
jgi:hypothetical protein